MDMSDLKEKIHGVRTGVFISPPSCSWVISSTARNSCATIQNYILWYRWLPSVTQTSVQLPTGYSHQNVLYIPQFQFGNLKVSKGKYNILLALKPAPSSSFYITIYWDSHARNLRVILGVSFILIPYICWVMMPCEYYLLNVSVNISLLLPLPQRMPWTTSLTPTRSLYLQLLTPQTPASIALSNIYMSSESSLCKSCKS